MRRRTGRMEAVLRVRKAQEDIAAAERRRADVAVAHEEARLADREADMRRPWGDRAIVELAFDAVNRAEAALADVSAVAESRREQHLLAVQRARAIERLVERRRAEAATEEARRAAAVLDDLALTRHTRKGRR